MSVVEAEATSVSLAQPAVDAEKSADKATSATYVVFSGELDKQLMAFTLANTAAASGMKTTMFFTFWALAALRDKKSAKGKNFVERMFGRMLPRGSTKLPMSNLNFGGMGSKMIRWRMRRCGVASLEEQITAAQALGVTIVACEASMEMMGFRHEELLGGSTELGGAVQCLAAAAGSDIAMVV